MRLEHVDDSAGQLARRERVARVRVKVLRTTETARFCADPVVNHFRSGTTKRYQDHDQGFMREMAEGLKTLPRIFLDLVLPRLPGLEARLETGGRVLDVGCGGGWAVVQIAEQFTETHCVGIDVEPYSVDLARQLIVERGLTDRCKALVRSIDELGEDETTYDVVTSFLVVHEIPPALKAAAFAAVARALKPGGYFLIFDEVYPETDEALGTMPTRFAALAQWYEVTWGNVVDTRSVLHALCQQAGLRVAEETSFSRFSVTLATKPIG